MHYRAPLPSLSSNIRRRSNSVAKSMTTSESNFGSPLAIIDDCGHPAIESSASLIQDQNEDSLPVENLPSSSSSTCSSFTAYKSLPASLYSMTTTITHTRGVHAKFEQEFRSMYSSVPVYSCCKPPNPATGTTSKFTNKWPAPAPLRRFCLSNNLNVDMPELSHPFVETGETLRDENQRWTLFKWCLLLSVLTVFTYGLVGIVWVGKTWLRGWDEADVLRVVDNDILAITTLTATMLLFTSLVGVCGVFINSRPILALYSLLLWPALMSIAAIGYTSYHRVTYALDHKMNLSWSRYLTPLERLLVQDALHCCGYSSPLHGATLSSRCYPRSPLPGCKSALTSFERHNLTMIWSAAFSVAALHLLNIVVAMLCANHLTDTFGRGITPKQYRLTAQDVRAEAERTLAETRGKVNLA